jgi:hypothetical protein
MQDKFAAIREADTLEDLTTYLTTPGLQKLRPAPNSMNT